MKVPTAQPTLAPTPGTPTVFPTKEPSLEPTYQPTVEPSVVLPPIATARPSAQALFPLFSRSTNPNENSKELIYLDRHDLNCWDDVIHRFHIKNVNWQIAYEFDCMNVKDLARVMDRQSHDNGANEDHNLIYYDRQHVWCPEGYLMSHFYGVNRDWNFGYGFECKKYDVEAMVCSDHYTG